MTGRSDESLNCLPRSEVTFLSHLLLRSVNENDQLAANQVTDIMEKRIRTVILAASAILAVASCNSRSNRSSGMSAHRDDTPKPNPTSVVDSLPVGTPSRLCDQVLTSMVALESITDTTIHDYSRETTPVSKAFFCPPDDLEESQTAQLVSRRYNLSAVMNHVIHSYELFCRKASELQFAADDDSTIVITKADTLAIIRDDTIPIPAAILNSALPSAADRRAARTFLAAYGRFDGDDSGGSSLDRAFSEYRNYFDTVPKLFSEEVYDEYSEKMDDWYDKRNYVSEIDMIQLLRVKDKAKLTDRQLEHFRKAVESEPDIDRRAILALEYVKWDEWNGAVLLGEILESGQYTRYLYETWITWRAVVQISHIGPSSFCVIPNNYFDQVRVKCLETMLRHYESCHERFELCMIEDMAMHEILHRQGSIIGNESLATLAELQYGMFVHPRVLDQKR